MKRTLARIAAFFAIGIFFALPGHQAIGQSANGVPINGIASWDITKVAYVPVDNDSGSDTANCLVLASPGATISPSGHTCKTLEHVFKILPKIGNGRSLVILLKPRSGGATYKKIDATTDDSLNFSGFSGYAYLLRRGSTDLTNSASDKAFLGAIRAVNGPNGDSSFTVTTGATVSGFSIAAGSLGATDALVGYRWRFDAATTTVALRNVSCFVNANTSTGVTCGTDLGTAPANGDTGFVERPGVRVLSFKEADESNGVPPASWPAHVGADPNDYMRALFATGIAVTGSAVSSMQFGGHADANYSFIEGTASTSSPACGPSHTLSGDLWMGSQWFDEAGTSLLSGAGLRSSSRCTFKVLGRMNVSNSAFLESTTRANFAIGAGSVGYGGSYFAGGVQFNVSDAVTGDVSTIGTVNAGERRTRILGGPTRIAGNNVLVRSVDASNAGGNPALTLGFSVFNTHRHFVIDDVVGSSGNTSVGIDASALVGGSVILGRTSSNTVTGAGGDIKVAGGTILAHSALSTTDYRDNAGNWLIGSGGSTWVGGTLGLGTSTPLTTFDIGGNGSSSQRGVANEWWVRGDGTSTLRGKLRYNLTAFDVMSDNTSDVTITTNTGVATYVQRVFVNAASGNVNLGTSTTDSGQRLYVQGRAGAARGASVVSAGTVTLGSDGWQFPISGTATINYITTTGFQAGAPVWLSFTSTATLAHNAGSVPGGTASILLRAGANYTATAGAIVELVYNGTNWVQPQ